MKNDTVRKFAVIGGVMVAIVLALVIIFPKFGVNLNSAAAVLPVPPATSAPSVTSTSATPVSVPSGCATKVHSFANDAPAGSNDFGPDQKFTDVKSGQKRLALKVCTDPEFLATMVAYYDKGLKLNADAVDQKARYYVSHKAQWKKDADAYLKSIASVSVTTDSHTYQTLGMVPHGASLPTLVRSDQKVVAGKVLVLHFKNGTVREVRIICDLQPVEDTFPNVPTPPAAPSSPPPSTYSPPAAPSSPPPSTYSPPAAPSSPPPSTYSPPAAPSSPPPSTYSPPAAPSSPPPSTYSPPPTTGCGCVTKPSASQPVPTPPTQATPVPTQAPIPLPTGPGGTQAPPTTAAPSGYTPVGGTAPGGAAGPTSGPATTIQAPKPDPTPSQAVPTTDPVATGTPIPPG